MLFRLISQLEVEETFTWGLDKPPDTEVSALFMFQ